jgi:hypothetical protein
VIALGRTGVRPCVCAAMSFQRVKMSRCVWCVFLRMYVCVRVCVCVCVCVCL